MARQKRNAATGKTPVDKNKNGTSASTQNKWTNRERIILRQRKRETGDKIDDVASWFHLTYGKVIKSSTLCDFLGDKHEWLDSVDPNNPPEKRYIPHWPMLDKILVAWLLYQLSRGEKVNIPALLKAGKEIWALLPPEGQFNVHYKKIMQPGWTTGFAQRLKNRYNLAPMAKEKAEPLPVSPLDAIKDTRALVDLYTPENVYNMDECGLFWKRNISRNLAQPANQPQPETARICLTLCCNADGSDRLPIQFIGRSEMPSSFGFAENNTREWVWTNNKCAWMTLELMVEWLHVFYMHVGRREVLLLMSGAGVHKCAVMQKPPPSNIRLRFLPPSLANAIQPLRQGIVKKLKHCFLRRLLQAKLEACQFFALTKTTGALVPETPFALTFKNAILWLHSAWKNEVKNATIRKCWVRSSLMEDTLLEQVWADEESSKELLKLYARVVRLGRFPDPVCAEAFLHPHGEDDQPFLERPTIADLVYWHLPVTPQDRLNEESQQVEFTPRMLQYYAQSVADLRFFLESTCQLTEELKSLLSATLLIVVSKLRQLSRPPGTEIMANDYMPDTGKEGEEDSASGGEEVSISRGKKDSVKGAVVAVDSELSIAEEELEGAFVGDESGDSEMSERSEAELEEG